MTRIATILSSDRMSQFHLGQRMSLRIGWRSLLIPLLSGGMLSGCVNTALPDNSSDTQTLIPMPTASMTVSPTGLASPTVSASPTGLASPTVSASPTGGSTETPTETSTSELLQQSWQAYKQQFIQPDGRVIDREAGDRSTSEGQAYAMLRAVFINDPDTFAKTLTWAEANLQRRGANGNRSDTLWCWKWGKNAEGIWGVLDANFASDGDLDAVTALIFAARRWNRPDYLALARTKLQDLWNLSTVTAIGSSGDRYFLPGPKVAFQPLPNRVYLNPSYLAPYAFRLFAQVDTEHPWLKLVESSYRVLNQSAGVSAIGLPSDWVALDLSNGSFQPIASPSSLRSVYGFDAYRVWWRVALDATWFGEPRAKQYLQQRLTPLQARWRSNQIIPAQIDLRGQPMVNYESTAQYAMLYAAFHLTDPAIADQIRQQKLAPTYQNGFWDNDSAYYTQNLSWFGLFSSTEIAADWLQP
jgi:endoglucanase